MFQTQFINSKEKKKTLKMDYIRGLCCKIMADNSMRIQGHNRTQRAMIRTVAGPGNSGTEDAFFQLRFS